VVVAVLMVSGCDYLGLGGGGQEGAESSGSSAESSGSKPSDGEGKSKPESEPTADKEADNKEPKEAAGDNTDDGSAGGSDKGQGAETAPPKLAQGSGGGEGKSDQQKARRNPFAPDDEMEEEEEPVEERPDNRNLGPLQKHKIGEYRLAGIISEVAVPKAMFIDPEGTGHLIKEGDNLGRKGGFIKDVRDNEVEIEIPPEGDNGKAQRVTVKLREAAMPSEQEDELSEEEQETLKRLLESEEGRKAVRESYQQQATPGANASERQKRQRESQGGSSGSDARFPGLEPPE
jgi:hypothetical protein